MRYLFRLLCVCALGVTPVAGCGVGEPTQCQNDVCPCNEGGIRDAIAKGGGSYTFNCDGPTTVVTGAEIMIDNDVILRGEGNLTVDGNESHQVFSVSEGVTVELRGFGVTNGSRRAGRGAGISNEGTLTLADSRVSENDGGGIFNAATLTVMNSTVSGNSAVDVGGIDNSGGTLTVMNSTVSGNSAVNGAAGVMNWQGTLTIIDSVVSENHTEGIGGGIFNLLGTLTLTNSTVSANAAQFGGGGIRSSGGATLTMSGSTVSDNEGGGLLVSGSATVIDSMVSGNTSEDSGGGIHNEGTLMVTNSTISSNASDQEGGGIYNGASSISVGNGRSDPAGGILTLTNSTVSGNSADRGGGIANSLDWQGRMTLVNSTVSGNTDEAGAGIWNGWMMSMSNTLIDDACDGVVTSDGYNIESPGDTCGFEQTGDLVNITEGQLDLGPLQDNRGPTMTHALGADSVALDRIPEVDCEVETDQRGEPRPETGGTMCDVGSFERQPEDL